MASGVQAGYLVSEQPRSGAPGGRGCLQACKDPAFLGVSGWTDLQTPSRPTSLFRDGN